MDKILFKSIFNTYSDYFERKYSEYVIEYFVTIVFPKYFEYKQSSICI